MGERGYGTVAGGHTWGARIRLLLEGVEGKWR
jgi:hypothetical protein